MNKREQTTFFQWFHIRSQDKHLLCSINCYIFDEFQFSTKSKVLLSYWIIKRINFSELCCISIKSNITANIFTLHDECLTSLIPFIEFIYRRYYQIYIHFE